jgi:hypothetical protein
MDMVLTLEAAMSPPRTYPPQNWIVPAALAGDVIVDIGQVEKATRRALEKLVRAGTLLQWRGKWYPLAGASWGLGPDKTCWGLTSKYGVES